LFCGPSDAFWRLIHFHLKSLSIPALPIAKNHSLSGLSGNQTGSVDTRGSVVNFGSDHHVSLPMNLLASQSVINLANLRLGFAGPGLVSLAGQNSLPKGFQLGV